ncbi:MAG: thioredoxin [Propionibacteriaceae bacterium]|jgi:thioredoxin 1|nr:thioredoxin [Propionibacteriaceae bacterium]
MATTALTAADFESVIGEGIVLIDFWAAWCGPCRMFGPIFEEVSEQYPDVAFAKVDTEAERDLAGNLMIQSIPTLMAFRDGILVFRDSGVLNASQLSGLVEQVKALDMDEVRRQVEAAAS